MRRTIAIHFQSVVAHFWTEIRRNGGIQSPLLPTINSSVAIKLKARFLSKQITSTKRSAWNTRSSPKEKPRIRKKGQRKLKTKIHSFSHESLRQGRKLHIRRATLAVSAAVHCHTDQPSRARVAKSTPLTMYCNQHSRGDDRCRLSSLAKVQLYRILWNSWRGK